MIVLRSIYFDAPPKAGRIVDFLDSRRNEERQVALFFVHGGGWKSGSRTIFHQIAHACNELGFDCATTDYRLSGVTIRDQVADILESLRLFAEDLKNRKRPDKIVLIGSSAGAHLALLAALSKDLPCHIAGLCVQAAPFTFEPWPDIFPPIWADMQAAAGASHETNPDLFKEYSPIHHIHPEMPPVFALHAENEHMFPFALTAEFSAKAISLGVRVESKIYPATEHGFFYGLERRQQKEAFADILTFIQSL